MFRGRFKSQGVGILTIRNSKVDWVDGASKETSEVSVVKISSIIDVDFIEMVNHLISRRCVVEVSILNPEVDTLLCVSDLPESIGNLI